MYRQPEDDAPRYLAHVHSRHHLFKGVLARVGSLHIHFPILLSGIMTYIWPQSLNKAITLKHMMIASSYKRRSQHYH